jgi:hypothetical protein
MKMHKLSVFWMKIRILEAARKRKTFQLPQGAATRRSPCRTIEAASGRFEGVIP